MRQDYLKWCHAGTFGALSSPDSAIIPIDKHRCIVSCLDTILLLNLRTSESREVVRVDEDKKIICFSLVGSEQFTDGCLLAIGLDDGSVLIVDLEAGDIRTTFKGHSSGVSALACGGPSKLLLATGGKDCRICLWDVAGETGQFKLAGHKGEITSINFLSPKHDQVIISTSRDGFVKLWDLESQRCFRTLVDHTGVVWGCQILFNGTRLVTSSSDGFLKLWRLSYQSDQTDEPSPGKVHNLASDSAEVLWDSVDSSGPVQCNLVGSIELPGRGPPRRCNVDSTGRLFTVSRKDVILFFKVRTLQELNKKEAKRSKKRSHSADGPEISAECPLELRPCGAARVSGRIAALYSTLVDGDAEAFRVVLAINNNFVEYLTVSVAKQEASVISTWQIPATSVGHRGQIGSVAFSGDAATVASVGADVVKMWNRKSGHCVRVIPIDGATCAIFLPGNRHILVATQSGSIVAVDLGSGESKAATDGCHEGPVTAVDLSSDNRTVASCGEDKCVRFWSLHIPIAGHVTGISQERILSMEDVPICVKFSSNGKFLAVSLLDSTIRVFYADSLKFFLSLYGHKLPCPSISISSDSTLIITASKDKNVKVWGLDFGDCHHSIFAHDDALSAVSFIPGTHQFFTVGADSKVNRWDADSGQLISSHVHPGVISLSCATTPFNEGVLVTGGLDGAIRLWEKTKEILVLSEEREAAEEKAIADAAATAAGGQVEPAGADTNVSLPVVPTADMLKAAEDIIEAVAIWENSKVTSEIDPLISAYKCKNADEFLSETLFSRVKPAHMQGALLRLPLSIAATLLEALSLPNRQILNRHPELSCRIMIFILRLHHGRLPKAVMLLEQIQKTLPSTMKSLRDVVGVNMAGLALLVDQLEEMSSVSILEDLSLDAGGKHRKKRTKARVV